ncbi:MAG: hypothetical protein Q7U73_05010 [Rubrivivax sp.]|nr:hypothetical protein [Rubrivivax sp.]
MKHATAARNWAQHLESGDLVAALLASLAEGMSTSPACSHLLPQLQDLDRARHRGRRSSRLPRYLRTRPTGNP